jgi:hypothetical protein
MEQDLDKKSKDRTFEEAIGFYNYCSGQAKLFLYLLLTQAVNNVTEVSELQLCYFHRSEDPIHPLVGSNPLFKDKKIVNFLLFSWKQHSG